MEQALFEVEMQHTDDTFVKLAHMQYDLFCTRNRIVRTLFSAGLVLLGFANSEKWWGILVIAYGCYILTSKYSSANHTAHKLTAQLKAANQPYPCSRYVFRRKAMDVITLPEGTRLGEPLAYIDVEQLGEDGDYFYVFRDGYGGYMVPKKALGAKEEAFREFLQRETGKVFRSSAAPLVRLFRWSQSRETRTQGRMLKKKRKLF